MVLATMKQESALAHRKQVGGPAKGLAQFERGGGVHGVLNHHASAKLAAAVCDARGVEPLAGPVYDALETDDILAACFARLLLLTDPAPLPAVGDIEGAFETYVHSWRPGAYTRGTAEQRQALRKKFERNYLEAMDVVVEGAHA